VAAENRLKRLSAMRRPIRALPWALALTLTGLACGGGHAEAARPAALAQFQVQAQAEGPQDEGPSQPVDERTEPTEEPPVPVDDVKTPSEEEVPGPDVIPRAGERRRIDPLDTVDDDAARTPHPAALAHPEHDVVVCEAGCDKTAGSIVFMKKRE
jgi:hypothetical protein